MWTTEFYNTTSSIIQNGVKFVGTNEFLDTVFGEYIAKEEEILR